MKTAHWNTGCWVVVFVLTTVSFGFGYWIGTRRLEAVADETARQRVEEVMAIGDRLGFIDRKRMDEVLIILAEERDDTSHSENDPL